MEKEIFLNKRKIKLTNPDKIFFPDEGYTKGDVIDYYLRISKYILPYLKNRPESLHRYPNGIKGESFYQKNVSDLKVSWLRREKVFSDSNKKFITYLICDDKAALAYMANLGCIEINPWLSKLSGLNKPDYMVIDLDPEGISFDSVVETALIVKEIFVNAGAECYCKTSGATGLHIYVPLKGKYEYEFVREFAYVIVRIANRMLPEITSLERSPAKRKKKVYLDYLQNSRGQTLAAPYSIRPVPGANVSTPLIWNEVKQGLSPQDFSIKNIFKRLEKKGDIFKDVLGKGINIERCLENLKKRYKEILK